MGRWLAIAGALGAAAAVGAVFYDGSGGQTIASGGPLPFGDASLLFDFYPGDSTRLPGVARLDMAPCTDGACPAPSFVYNGYDATASAWPAWTYGDSLSLAGAGTAPTAGSLSPLLGTEDVSVLFGAGKAYQAAASTSGDLTTQDMRLAILFQFSGTNGQVLLEKRAAAGSGAGYTLDVNSGALRFTLSDGTHTASISTAALTSTAWYFAEIEVDKSGSAIWYVNGASSGTATDVSTVGSLTNSGKLTLGASITPANGYGKRIAYVALWARASWFVSHLQENLVTAQFGKLTATLPRCRGECKPSTRSHPEAFCRKWSGSTVTNLLLLGANFPCSEHNNLLYGYAPQKQAFNTVSSSEDITGMTKLDAGDSFSANSATMVVPDADVTTGDGLIIDSSNNEHGITEDIAFPTVGDPTYQVDDTYSVFVKAGTHTWVYLADRTTNVSAYFNLTACASCAADGFTHCQSAVGTVTAESPNAYNYGNGICRVAIQHTGLDGTKTFGISAADGDGDKTTSGDGASVSLYIWGRQFEMQSTPTRYIRTTAGQVTRTGDQLIYPAEGNVNTSHLTLYCSLVHGHHEGGYAFDSNIFEAHGALTSGDTRVNSIALMILDSYYVLAGEVYSGGSVTVFDLGGTDIMQPTTDARHTISLTASGSTTTLYVDGAADHANYLYGTSASGAFPVSLSNSIRIGMARTGSVYGGTNAVIERCQIYNGVRPL